MRADQYVGLDDLREWVSKAVDTHGWGPVLHSISDLLSDHADDFQAAGHPDTATGIAEAASLAMRASEQIRPGNRPKDEETDE